MEEAYFPPIHEVGRLPLFTLTKQLRMEKEQIRSKKGGRILKGSFGLYFQYNFAAEQLLEGVGKRMIEVCLLQVANFDHQKNLDVAFGEELKKWGHVQILTVKHEHQKAKQNFVEMCLHCN